MPPAGSTRFRTSSADRTRLPTKSGTDLPSAFRLPAGMARLLAARAPWIWSTVTPFSRIRSGSTRMTRRLSRSPARLTWLTPSMVSISGTTSSLMRRWSSSEPRLALALAWSTGKSPKSKAKMSGSWTPAGNVELLQLRVDGIA